MVEAILRIAHISRATVRTETVDEKIRILADLTSDFYRVNP